jgi:SAM-dependent methyltransferase
MREFWDERADEDPWYFVDNKLTYGHPDTERFWRDGAEDLAAILASLELEIGPTDAVVEVGCGLGRLTRPIAAKARRVYALDVSERMLERARALNPALENVEWLLGDGESLGPIADGSADACVSHVVFQHIPDPRITLSYVREMGRVLRPGGWTAFQVSNDPGVHRKRGSPLGSRLRAMLRRGPRGVGDPEWLGSAVDLDNLRSAATDGQMEIERVVGEGTQFCLVLARRATGREAA